MVAYVFLPSKNSWSEMMAILSLCGFHAVFGYHASMSSYRHEEGIIRTAHLLSRLTVSYTLYSVMRGKVLVVSSMFRPRRLSTAVMLHLVGAQLRLRPIPNAPTLNALWMPESRVP